MLSDISHPKHEFREYSDKMASYIYGPSFLKSIWDNSYKNDSVYNFLKDKIVGKFDDTMKSEVDWWKLDMP